MRKGSNLQTEADLASTLQVSATPFSGCGVGIIAVNLIYPKVPGNVANATTFDFPVLYEVVDFEIEELFEGSEQIKEQIVQAAKKLEKQGVRAIVGACGYFGHFQEAVAEAVDIPVFLSSIVQVPIINIGLKKKQKILTLVASGKDINADFFRSSGADLSDCIICEIGSLESFAPIRWGKTTLDNPTLEADLVATVKKELEKAPEIGAILLECSDLPPYSYAIQQAAGLPVFDFITLIRWVHSSVVQNRYYGHF
ncbi:aspartate/glutamate racemase family protein [Enterococcus sp. AZ196]|uniref:aspartate/glutamate racemase family protein n=1 Tax=Enterococcus sp. AZ196 TaxID=2774659 RepID=UPI003D2833DA